MLYECKNPAQFIVGVERVVWEGGSFEVEPREYSSLAFRMGGTSAVTVGEKTYCAGSGDILYLPQGLPYRAEYTDTDMLAIHFVTASDDIEPEIYTPRNAEQIYKAFIAAHTLWQNKALGHEAHVLSQLYYILGELCANELKNRMPEHFINALSYINTNYRDQDLSVEKICKNAAISQTDLRMLFRKYCQKTPVQYITRLRLEYARNLISCGEAVETAAEKSGYSDPKYFARVVKKHYNCTPRDLKTYGK
ncbi:MAG: helix-turn-helix transcriptional regulator [Clostridia bacterium]|nr:helix-turn-helix transcriptional regulator [Clostridia bacterium]